MSNLLNIGGRTVGMGQPCFVIAEAGSNHNRDLDTARALIDAAVQAGADAVKFQTFSADSMAARTDHPIASIADEFSKFGSTLHELYRKVELPREWQDILARYASAKGIIFLSTPFDKGAADELDALGVPCFKIASFELVDLPLLRHVARKGKPVIISTGMATIADIEDAVGAIESQGNRQIGILHCGIEYPPRWEDVHLRAMETIGLAFPYPVGYSDHTLGITIPIAVAARGGSIIEKHFTLDKTMDGPDHRFALDPSELKQMVEGIRAVEKALGGSRKQPVEAELKYLQR